MTTENPASPTPTEKPAEPFDAEKEFERLSQARDEGNLDEAFGKEPEAKPDATPAEPTAPNPDDHPAATPAPAPAPAAEPASTSAPAAIDWNTVPPAVKAAYDKAENERRAAIGRAAAAQREAALLKRQAQAPAPAPAQAANTGATDKLKDEFPELNAALDEREQRLQTLFDKKLEGATAKVKAEALNAVFPGWHGTMASEDFQYWLTTQDDATRAKFESDSVGDYAALLRDFHGSNGTAQDTATQSAAQIQADRKTRLENSTHVQGRKTAPNPTGEPDPATDNGEAYFTYLSRKRERASAGR